LGCGKTGVFDLSEIPELQQSEDEQSSRDIAEINAGLKTINDVLKERGKDTAEQHAAFWKYTLIPNLKQFESILETQFFVRFGLRENGVFDLSEIPELQQSEDEQSSRDIAEINAGLKTINDVLKERGKEPKPWGDVWYRPRNMIPTKKGDEEP
jgi:flagellar motility protein MotE (MotC chaperone)